jgi:hypothetical protein
MIPFRGRSPHTTKIKNKPIKEGLKVWVVAEIGYVYNWLFYSARDGTEGISKIGKKFWILQSIPLARSKQMFAPTFACVLQLAI